MMQKSLPMIAMASAMLLIAACDRDQTEEQQANRPAGTETMQQQPEAAVEQQHTIRGRVTAIDLDAAEITVDHEPVESLNWPAMIMPFPVRDSTLLEGIEVGDQVTFIVKENEHGEYVIQQINEDIAPPGGRA